MTPLTRLAWVASFASLAACAGKKHPATTIISAGPMTVAADPGLVEMTVEPTTSLVMSNVTSELGVRVRITAKELPPAKRPPLDLALVLDTSGSMEGDAINALRSSARALAAKLRDGDRISVVTFNSSAQVLVPNTVITARVRADIDKAIAHIHATGTTDLVGGLSQGLSQLLSGQFPQGINRIVLLSDGVPNSSVALPAMIASVHQQGVSVTSLGFGVDYDTVLMTQIARDTGGSFHFLEKPEEVATVFDAELVKMTTAVARNMQLYFQTGPGVTVPAMPGLQPTGDGRVVALIGDLPAGETRDLMIPISLMSRGDGSVAELANVTLAFDDVIGRSGQQKREGFVAAKVSNDATLVKAAVKIDLEVARIRATAAAATLQAINLARAGQIASARSGLATAIAAIKTAGKKLKDPSLDTLVQQLEELSKELAQIIVQQQQVVSDRTSKRPMPDMPAPPPSTAPAAVEMQLRRSEEKAAATVNGETPR
jgi:Ca-activated chloride channel homolog